MYLYLYIILAPFTTKYIRVIRVGQITAVLNITYKLGSITNIITGPSYTEGIKTVINVFAFALSRGIPYLSGLKQ